MSFWFRSSEAENGRFKMSGLKHQNSTYGYFIWMCPNMSSQRSWGVKSWPTSHIKRSIRHDAGCNLMAQAVHGTCAGSGWTPLTSYTKVKVTWLRLKLKLIRITGWRLCWKHEPVWVCIVRVGQMPVSWVCHGIGNPGNLANLERIPIQCLGLALCRGHHPT